MELTFEQYQELLEYWNNKLFTEIHILHPIYAPKGIKTENDIIPYVQSGLEGVIILDRNVFSEIIAAVKRGSFTSTKKTKDGDTRKKITSFILWASMHNMNLLPYWGVNEYAHDFKKKSAGNKELELFNYLFDNVPIEIIRDSFFYENITFPAKPFSAEVEHEKFEFDKDDASHIHLYGAILHLVYILNSIDNPDEQFRSFVEWYFENCLLSRYLLSYVFLFLSQTGIQSPHNYTNKDKCVRGCSNLARDIQYLQDLDYSRIDRKYLSKYAFFVATNEDDMQRVFEVANSVDDNDDIEQIIFRLCQFLPVSKQKLYFDICYEAYRKHITPPVNENNALQIGLDLVAHEQRNLENYFSEKQTI